MRELRFFLYLLAVISLHISWVLQAFVPITLTQVQLPDQTIRHVTPLTLVQEQILRLLGLPADLYAGLAREIPQTAFPLRE